tara:strand:+ start:117 stop:419 length:303 start_codon:yes stop_codon:yes gene_type:complete
MDTFREKHFSVISKRLRKQEKIILNKEYPDSIEVVIGEVHDVKTAHGHEIHYIVSFGGDKSITIIGDENWDAFLRFVDFIDDIAETTQEIEIPSPSCERD